MAWLLLIPLGAVAYFVIVYSLSATRKKDGNASLFSRIKPWMLLSVLVALVILLSIYGKGVFASKGAAVPVAPSVVNLPDGSQIAPVAKGRKYLAKGNDWSLWAPIRGIDVNVYYMDGRKVKEGLTIEFQDNNGIRRQSSQGIVNDESDFVRYRCEVDTYFTVERSAYPLGK
jgi:hypothetical protein